MKFSLLIIISTLVLSSAIPKKKPVKNVIFIAIDDMNNWIGANGGNAITPNIDALAQKGMLFTNAHCVVPACAPSRVSLMTGLRPETTGQYENPGNFRNLPGGKNLITIGQFLQTKGYETVAAGKIFHQPAGKNKNPNPLSDPESWSYQFPNNVGTSGHNLFLDENDQAKWLEGALKNERNKEGSVSYLSKFGVWGSIPQKKEQTADWENAEFAANYLQKSHEKPFFLACGIFRPHSPQLAPQEFFDLYPLNNIKVPELPLDDMDDIPNIAKTNFSSEFTKLVKSKGELQRAVQAYLASMSFADACIGEILKSLENSKYRDNTVVVLWSDHGWQLGHKNRWEKFSLWHQASNAPFIISYPEQNSIGKKCEQAISYLDVFPTLCDLLGFNKPKVLEGTSLVAQLKNPLSKRKIPAVITYPKGNHAVAFENWRYIKYQDGSEELYDHLNDPHEFKNIIENKQNSKIVNNLKKYIPQ
jgi:arylsulfatase A-like enzyme